MPRRHGGNISRSAEEIRISRRQLHRWLRREDLSPRPGASVDDEEE